MALTDILRTARDALSAQTLGLSVTGQNVANVNTPGYTRRRALLEPHILGTQSYGSVAAVGLERVADRYTEQRHYAAVGLSSSAEHQNRLLGHVESLFELESGIDVGSTLAEFLSSFSTLSTDPTNLAVRENVLGKARAFVAQLNHAAETTASFRTGLVEEATDTASNINELADSLAKVTHKISETEVLGHDAADLKDQRDAMLLELSELIDVRTFTNNKGQLVVQAGGTTLVEGDVARHLEISVASSGSLQILSRSPTGATTDISRLVNAGKLGAIQDLHDTHTQDILNALDNLALDVSTAINDQHALGFSLDGETGVQFFDTSGGPVGLARSLSLDATLDARRLAASSTLAGLPGNGDNAIALAQLANQDLALGATRTFSEAYGDLVADVGSRRADARDEAQVREAMEHQVYTMRESLSGVNLDEEMTELAKFQRAYEASSRVMATADELLENLINTLGR